MKFLVSLIVISLLQFTGVNAQTSDLSVNFAEYRIHGISAVNPHATVFNGVTFRHHMPGFTMRYGLDFIRWSESYNYDGNGVPFQFVPWVPYSSFLEGQQLMLRVGIEKLFGKHKVQPYVGMDVVTAIERDDITSVQYDGVYDWSVYQSQAGIAVLAGFRYTISQHFFVHADANLLQPLVFKPQGFAPQYFPFNNDQLRGYQIKTGFGIRF